MLDQTHDEAPVPDLEHDHDVFENQEFDGSHRLQRCVLKNCVIDPLCELLACVLVDCSVRESYLTDCCLKQCVVSNTMLQSCDVDGCALSNGGGVYDSNIRKSRVGNDVEKSNVAFM